MSSEKYFIGLIKDQICRRLNIDDFHYVEIESKKRVLPNQAKALKKYLEKKTDDSKTNIFLDQFLDTPQMDLFKKGASMRLRYKRNGAHVYLQYKGPGFKESGVLYRSEFSTGKLKNLMLEESRHDIVRFAKMPIHGIIRRENNSTMGRAMKRQLGTDVIRRISKAPIISVYRKEKFKLDLGSAFLEPSLDRVMAFHINGSGLHPLSTFWEYENEIKAKGRALDDKIEHIADLLEFDEKVSRKFDLKPEPLDKYHRCTSIFLPRKS